MWIPLIISVVVIFVTVILLNILEKMGKIKQKSKTYKIIEIIGACIPTVVISANYSYIKTDTLKEAIIVTIGILICITLYVLFLEKWKTNNYNYIILVIITLCSYIIINIIIKYMLSNIYVGVFTALLGSIVGNSIVNNKNKWKLIITAILMISIVIIGSTKYEKYFVSNNKVKRISIEFIENMGYDITDNDYIDIFGSSTRKEPIYLLINRRKSDWNWTVIRRLKMVYFKGKIIQFSKEK